MIRVLLLAFVGLVSGAGCAPDGCAGVPGESTASAWPGWAAPAHYRYLDFAVPADAASGGDMATPTITILQVQATGNAYGAAGSIAWFTPNNNLTPGSTLVIGSWNDDATDTDSAVSDATNGTWGHRDAISGAGAGVGYLYWWGKANNTASGKPQVSITTTASFGKHSGVFVEIAGASASTPFGTYATYTTAYGDPIFTGSLTTSTTDAILGFAVNPAKNSGLGSAGANAGYTLTNFSGDMDFTGLLYRVAAAGTYNPGYSSTLNAFFGTSINIKP